MSEFAEAGFDLLEALFVKTSPPLHTELEWRRIEGKNWELPNLQSLGLQTNCFIVASLNMATLENLRDLGIGTVQPRFEVPCSS